MNDQIVVGFQSLVHAAAAMLTVLGAAIAVYGFFQKEGGYVKLGVGGAVVSGLIFLLTR